MFSTNAIIGFCLGLMRGDRIVDLVIGGIKYNYDKRMIIMAIATPNALTDNRIRYVTNNEGKTIDVIIPVELWQQIIVKFFKFHWVLR